MTHETVIRKNTKDEYRWACKCGTRSVWFPTKLRAQRAANRHETNGANR